MNPRVLASIVVGLTLVAPGWAGLRKEERRISAFTPGYCTYVLMQPDQSACGAGEQFKSVAVDVEDIVWIPIGIANETTDATGVIFGAFLTPFMIPAGALGLAGDIITMPVSLIAHAVRRHRETLPKGNPA